MTTESFLIFVIAPRDPRSGFGVGLGYSCGIFNLDSQLWPVEQQAITIQDIAAQQDVGFSQTDYGTNFYGWQVMNLNRHQIHRKFGNSAAKSLEQEAADLN